MPSPPATLPNAVRPELAHHRKGTGIRVESLTHGYGSRTVVEGVSFEAPTGEITALLGANGAGKSTTLKAAAGLLTPRSGRVLFDGAPLSDFPLPGRTVGFVLDPTAMHPGRTVRESLRLAGILVGAPASAVTPMLEQVGLANDGRKRVSQLSLGMRQRLALGIALLGKPRHLVLDEPSNGLDVHGGAWVHETLREAAAAGASVLLSSHMLRDVEALADRIVVIDQGHVVAEGTTAELLRPRGTLVASRQLPRLADILDARGISHLPAQGMMLADAPAAEVGKIALEAGISLEHLSASTSGLHELFMSLTTDRRTI
jgi:ABC-2 type transport system ATP-binding protein